jgi:hypothetical protein
MRFRVIKYTIYALLVLDLFFFVRQAPTSAALDSLGWLILLSVFEFETGRPSETYAAPWHGWAVLTAQGLGYILVLLALSQYVLQQDWLDCINTVLWLLVVFSLAYDVYAPGPYGNLEWRMRNLIKTLLYAGLAGIAMSWAFTGDLFDFYDAALWVVCFLVVERNIFGADQPISKRNPLASEGSGQGLIGSSLKSEQFHNVIGVDFAQEKQDQSGL